MGEKFLRWANRMTKAGTYDMTETIKFIADLKAHARSQGKKGVANVWWQKIKGKEVRQGRFPLSMRNPVTKELFTFPMFDVVRMKGKLVEAKLVEPTCAACGGTMQRYRDSFGKERYRCPTHTWKNCEAWTQVIVGAPKEVDPELLKDEEGEEEEEEDPTAPPAPEPEPLSPRERLIKRICELVDSARRCVEEHGMSLPIGYRTVKHLAILAHLLGDADNAMRLWADGRLGEDEREKWIGYELPVQPYKHAKSIDEEPAWYHLIAKVIDAGLPVLMVGEAGSGKTRFAEWYGAKCGKRVHMAIGSDDVAGRELWIARRDASGGKTTNVEGPAAKAARNGEILFLDECDGFPANSLLPLNAILNGDSRLNVPVLGEIEVNPAVRVLAAANTNGRSKGSRAYAGRNRLDGAFLNRFAVVVRTCYEERIDRKVADEILASLETPAEEKKETPTPAPKKRVRVARKGGSK